VVFGLMDDYPNANARHYRFLLEGLADVAATLNERRIAFDVRRGHPADVAMEAARGAAAHEGDAGGTAPAPSGSDRGAIVVVCDRGYLRHQVEWRARVAREAGRRVIQVEGDVVVPVEVASDKREYAARTIRPKIERAMGDYLVDLRTTAIGKDSRALKGRASALASIDPTDIDAALGSLALDTTVPPVHHLFRGGTTEARRRLSRFVEERLKGYDEHRNQPHTDDLSYMGMYLHFGQISPVEVALTVEDSRYRATADRDAFLEELVVRRELAMNYTHYEPDYDAYAALPGWARKTLTAHRDDEREHVYTRRELENAETHDPYWNAAMREMRYTGYMHNYMRMYWGKKIIEWTNTPELAHRVALDLNNAYFLDGRDPNSYANVGWLFGLHDRPWGERDIFGTVRYMSSGGLERKADPEAYVAKVDRLVRQAREAGVTFD
jgi:deoxyribodipyrimidine photo-lyase